MSVRQSILVSFPRAASAPEVRGGEASWLAVYTCARHEKSVARQLEERGIDGFLPLYKSWRRWADRRKQVELEGVFSIPTARPRRSANQNVV